jgi:hypothetical protein
MFDSGVCCTVYNEMTYTLYERTGTQTITINNNDNKQSCSKTSVEIK